MSRKLGFILMAGSLSVQAGAAYAANFGTTNLYDSLGGVSLFGNIGDADYPDPESTSGQEFNASNSSLASALSATAMIDRVALHFNVDPNEPNLGDPGLFQCQVRLWTWNTDLATTMGQTPLADSGVITLPGGFDGWVNLNCSPIPSTGTYFLGVTRRALAINGQWRLVKTNNSTAADSVCYRAGASTTSRELQLQLHWFEPGACGPSSVARVTSISGAAGQSGDAAKVITLHGTNLNTITAASIVRQHSNGATTTIDSAALAMDGSDLKITFNLAGAEGGPYNLMLIHPCDRIDNALDPVLNDTALLPLQNAVVVYLPSLTNGGFEEAYDGTIGNGFCGSPRGKDLIEAKHWGYSVSMPSTIGFVHRRDGAIYVPGCTGTTPTGGEGLHYGSFIYGLAATTFPVRHAIFQTIAAPNVIGQTAHRGTDVIIASKVSQTVDQAVLRLRDGTFSGPVIASSAVLAYTGTDPLQDSPRVSVPPGYTFISNPPLLTIEYQYDSTTGGVVQHASDFDNVRVTSGCFSPAEDSDGDGDVDMDDFGAFQRCYTGPSGTVPIPTIAEYSCNCFDTNIPTGRIDENDFTSFVACAGVAAPGAGVPPAGTCH